MANGLPPGIGNAQEAMQATAFIRQQPWYQQMVRGWGLNPAGDENGNVHLNEAQQQQLLDTARQHGIGISDSYHIDENGQIADVPSHVLRNVLIGAGIGGAALTGLGAFGIGPLSGLLGAGGTASSVAGGLGPSTAANIAGTGAAMGGAGVPSALAAPAIGAASGLPDWLSTARNVGGALSAASAGRAQGRVLEGIQNQNQARAAVDLYNAELNAPGKIAGNAVRGDILSNAQDATVSGIDPRVHVPTISGGLRPSMFSPATRATGTTITNNAQQSANALTPLTPPVLPQLPQAGGLDEALNAASAISGVASQIPWDKIPWGKIAGAF